MPASVTRSARMGWRGDNPAGGVEGFGDRLAQRASDVVALFGPVDAAAHGPQPGGRGSAAPSAVSCSRPVSVSR